MFQYNIFCMWFSFPLLFWPLIPELWTHAWMISLSREGLLMENSCSPAPQFPSWTQVSEVPVAYPSSRICNHSAETGFYLDKTVWMCMSSKAMVPNTNELSYLVHFENVQIPRLITRGLDSAGFFFFIGGGGQGGGKESAFHQVQVSKDQAGFVCLKAPLGASHFVLKRSTVFFQIRSFFPSVLSSQPPSSPN